MVKSFKKGAVVLIMLSVLFFIGGMCFSKLADDNRGLKVYHGYSTSSERAGANKKGEEVAEGMAVASYSLGAIFLICGVIYIVTASKKQNAKTVYRNGRILEKNANGAFAFVVVEFDDNTRRRMVVEPPLIVAQGDKGQLGYKGNSLVEFIKE